MPNLLHKKNNLLYSYHFIANSTSYLNVAGYLKSFSGPVLLQIDFMGVGRPEGGGMGGKQKVH